MDPDAEEEALMEAVVSVAMNEDGELVGVFKPGGTVEASETTLMHCIAAAKLRQGQLFARIICIDCSSIFSKVALILIFNFFKAFHSQLFFFLNLPTDHCSNHVCVWLVRVSSRANTRGSRL